MRIRIAIACMGLAAGVAVIASAVDRSGDSIDRTPVAPVEASQTPPRVGTPLGMFDRCVQERFRNVKDQGMARMPVLHRGVKQFSPETSGEIEAVDWLRDEGMVMGFFLGGRRLLDSEGMTEAQWEGSGIDRHRTINGPIFVTDSLAPADFPRPWQLAEHGRKALAASTTTTTDSYSGTLGRWSIEARAIRADRVDCLLCHRSVRPADANPVEKDRARLKIGDALGVMIYVYTRPGAIGPGTGQGFEDQ
jgi:hypothetical protein